MSALLQVMSLLLIVCMLLLLWGCSTRPLSVPLATPEPPLLATVQMPLPFVETVAPRLAPPPAFATTALQSRPTRGVVVSPPNCYRQTQHSVVCIGQIVNIGKEAIGNLRLRLQLGAHAQTITPEQRVIAVGGFAPYHAIFQGAEDRASIALESLTSVSNSTLPLSVVTESGRYVAGRVGYGLYHYEVTLRADADVAQPWQAIVTLFSSNHQMVGYRVLEQDVTLRQGDTLTLSTSITPLIVDADYYTTLTLGPR